MKLTSRLRYLSVSTKAIPFAVVAAFLRLGSKYSIQSLTAEATERLMYEFPTNLDNYDKNKDYSMIEKAGFTVEKVINLVRKTQQLTRILPLAFYYLVKRTDAQNRYYAPERADDRELSFSHEEQKVYIRGWTMCIKAQQKHTYQWLFQEVDSPSCLMAGDCSSGRARAIISRFTPVPRVIGLTRWMDWPKGVVICESCKAAAK